MDWVRTINDAIEYMEENLTEDITLADISCGSGYTKNGCRYRNMS